MDSWLKTGNLRKAVASTSSEAYVVHAEETTSSATTKCDNEKLISSKTAPKRKYDEGYLNFGFTCTGNKDTPDALCVLCNKILVNSSMAPG